MKRRVITACLLIPPVLLAVFLNSPVALGVLALATFTLSYLELRKLAGVAPASFPVLWLGVAFAFSPWLRSPANGLLLALLSALGASACYILARGKRGYWLAELASLWIAAPLAAMLLLKSPDLSRLWKSGLDWTTPVLLCLIPLWTGDTLAIFAGRAFGKHLLAPKISPKKTVEGGVANLVGCVVGAWALALILGRPAAVGLLVGLAAGVLGQLGDLLESALKRSAGVKDSGTLLPGHGGLLDRIDSILLSAPFVALIVLALSPGAT